MTLAFAGTTRARSEPGGARGCLAALDAPRQAGFHPSPLGLLRLT